MKYWHWYYICVSMLKYWHYTNNVYLFRDNSPVKREVTYMHQRLLYNVFRNLTDLGAILSHPLTVSPKVLIIEFISSLVTGERNIDYWNVPPRYFSWLLECVLVLLGKLFTIFTKYPLNIFDVIRGSSISMLANDISDNLPRFLWIVFFLSVS